MSEEFVGNNDWIPHISRLFSEVPYISLRWSGTGMNLVATDIALLWSDELNAGFPHKLGLRR
ncbi:MAG: hypothetical protein OXT74_07375 [Candidatus Poribacteria bacterium]|nr:hypothetical protein [Candidatus Poribacteria bacterium]